MKFGVRECANIVFRAKTPTNIGKYKFKAGQPVLYIDTATTSSVEQATSTVYAQGGRGNVRLISWEGEKTLTFTVEDALLSPVSLAMLSGADLFQGSENVKKVHFHTTSNTSLVVKSDASEAYVDLSGVLGSEETLCPTNDSPIYVIITEPDGSLTGEMIEGTAVTVGKPIYTNGAISGVTTPGSGEPSQAIKITAPVTSGLQSFAIASGDGTSLEGGKSYAVFVDYYLDKKATAVDELQIAADNFAGNYYVEADTLFRRKSDGVDMPANLTFPNVKIQSNLTFQLSGTGDPSTFTFTMDALPGYTYFDKSREVLCVIQVIEDQTNADKIINPVMPHNTTLEHKNDEIDDTNYIGYGGANPTSGNITIKLTNKTIASDDTEGVSVAPVAVGGGTISSSTYISSNSAFDVSSAGLVTRNSTTGPSVGDFTTITVTSTFTTGETVTKTCTVTCIQAAG